MANSSTINIDGVGPILFERSKRAKYITISGVGLGVGLGDGIGTGLGIGASVGVGVVVGVVAGACAGGCSVEGELAGGFTVMQLVRVRIAARQRQTSITIHLKILFILISFVIIESVLL